MKKVQWKDSVREIKLSFARFVSIFAIIFVGVAFFAGIKSTAPDMKHSVDIYYDEYQMADIRVLSTLGLLDEDIAAIAASDGVESVQPGYFCDVVATIDATEFVYKVHSIPQEIATDPDKKYINRIKIIEGRYPQKSGECVIEDSSFIALDLAIGDVIEVSSGKSEAITDSTLKVDRYTIVGKALAPYYLSYEKGSSDIGSGKANFFMMILESDFIIPCYTEGLVTIENARELSSYSQEYTGLVERAIAPMENLGIERTQLRIDDIRDQANATLEESREAYSEQKAIYEDEINEASSALDDAQLELVEAQATLDTNKENFYTYYAESSDQLSDAQKKLNSAQGDYTSAQSDYDTFVDSYGDDLASFDETTQTLNENRAKAQQSMDSLDQQLENSELSDQEIVNIEELIGYYSEYITVIDDQLDMMNNLNTVSHQQQENTEDQLSTMKRELDSQSRELSSARGELRRSKRESEAQFIEAQATIDEGWIQYNEGMAELAKQKEEGQLQLYEGMQKINEAQKEIEKLKKPQWHVLSREQLYSYVDYGKTADRIDAIAKIFPVFFFVVASLVCLTTMTRMVDEQRGSIGTYKALGYSNTTIAKKYILYAAIASTLGGVCGIFAGTRVFPEVIYNAWTMMYSLPPFARTPQIVLLVSSVVIGVLVTTLAALTSCNTSLKETPSMLMRPKAPKPGKKVFLESIKSVWKRLSFSQKVTVRNLFRYKKRFFMTIIGIIGCCALLLAGFGLNNSISRVVDKQYKEVFTYHLNMRYSEYSSDDQKLAVMDDLDNDEDVLSYLATAKINVSMQGKNDNILVSLVVPEDLRTFPDYITLRHRGNEKPITLPKKGMIITEKLAKELRVGVGDFVEVTDENGQRKKVLVSDITENYVFHYAYMSQQYYAEIFLHQPIATNLMIKLVDATQVIESELGSRLIADDAVASLEYYSEAVNSFSDMVKILNSIVIVIIASAGLLAFVVVYNLTNINICERIREIATLKVLGFYGKEVGAYVYRENIILATIGSVIGLFFGTILHRFIMVSIEQDGVMFGNHIEPISFAYAFAITIGFVVLVNLIMYRKIKNVPMVESLKSVE